MPKTHVASEPIPVDNAASSLLLTGPSTIVGSAAFNLLIISAVCIGCLSPGKIKSINEFGVFLMTSFWSLWAYVWLLIVLQFWTPHLVTIEEAVLTFIQFPLLVLTAWAQDRKWWRARTWPTSCSNVISFAY